VLTAREVVRRLGGRATYAEVTRYATRASVRRALASGDLHRPRRGIYALPALPAARTAAARLGGVLSHTSAARELGLELGHAEDAVHVTVPRGGRVVPQPGVVAHWKALPAEDVTGDVTTPLRTVLDCATVLPFPQALAVADSALQLKYVGAEELVTAARSRRGPGRAACLRVATWADHRADNGFESVLRGTLVVAGVTDLVPQVPVRLGRFTVHVDLADVARRIAVEGDSFTYHATRPAFTRDCERYDELGVAGWLVLRFTWEQVAMSPAWVVDVVRRGRAGRRRRSA